MLNEPNKGITAWCKISNQQNTDFVDIAKIRCTLFYKFQDIVCEISRGSIEVFIEWPDDITRVISLLPQTAYC
jgi:hypothetical protein